MKKYLCVLIPFLACGLLALLFAVTDPNPEAIYGRDWIYDYLSQAWFAIGVVLSGLTLITLLIHDLFEVWERAAKRRSRRK